MNRGSKLQRQRSKERSSKGTAQERSSKERASEGGSKELPDGEGGFLGLEPPEADQLDSYLAELDPERRAAFEAHAFKQRRDEYVDEVTNAKTRPEVSNWIRRLYELYPRAYGDPAYQDEEEEEEEPPMLLTTTNPDIERPESDEEEVSSSGDSLAVECVSAQGKGGFAEADDKQIAHFLLSMGPQQKRVFTAKLHELGAAAHDEVVADTVATVQARQKRTRHLQVISESKSELRLANTKRIAFKKELHDRMPKILRVAALAALKVHEPEEAEAAATAAQTVYEYMTKPTRHLEENPMPASGAHRVELFMTHHQGSTVAPRIYKPLARFLAV